MVLHSGTSIQSLIVLDDICTLKFEGSYSFRKSLWEQLHIYS
jgi:hypothetical protein